MCFDKYKMLEKNVFKVVQREHFLQKETIFKKFVLREFLIFLPQN